MDKLQVLKDFLKWLEKSDLIICWEATDCGMFSCGYKPIMDSDNKLLAKYMNRTLYLTDIQFLRRLKILRKYIDNIEKPSGYDDTTIGCKNTEVNVGFCNQDETTIPEDMRLFEDRPRIIRYRNKNHKCPLDGRVKPELLYGWEIGCFYKCLYFNDKNLTMEKVKNLYEETIKELERGMS